MTIQAYGPEKMNQFALRLLDLASVMREMANSSREQGIVDLAIHDKKAQEWCGRLEEWLHKAQGELEIKIRQSRAKQRALSLQ